MILYIIFYLRSSWGSNWGWLGAVTVRYSWERRPLPPCVLCTSIWRRATRSLRLADHSCVKPAASAENEKQMKLLNMCSVHISSCAHESYKLLSSININKVNTKVLKIAPQLESTSSVLHRGNNERQYQEQNEITFKEGPKSVRSVSEEIIIKLNAYMYHFLGNLF